MRRGYVYFIQTEGPEGPIKIGFSKNVDGRLAKFNTIVPKGFECLAQVMGTTDTERELHGLFADCRKAGEWFSCSPELLSLIEEIKANGEAALKKHGLPLDPGEPEIPQFPVLDRAGLALFLRERCPKATAATVAELAGVSRQTVEGWLYENVAPQMKQFGALLEAFGPDLMVACCPQLSEEPWVESAQKYEHLRSLNLKLIEHIDAGLAIAREDIRLATERVRELEAKRAEVFNELPERDHAQLEQEKMRLRCGSGEKRPEGA